MTARGDADCPRPWQALGLGPVFRDPLPRRVFWTFWLLYAVCMVVAKCFRTGGPISPRLLGESAITAVWQTAVWLGLCLVALAVAARFPLGPGRWRNLGGVLLSAVAAVFAWVALHRLVYCKLWMAVCSPWPGVWMIVPTMLSAYLALLGIGYALQYVRRYGEQEISERQMEAQLAEARLVSLKMQLHPHFLFNTLQSVSTLMYRDVPAAEAMLDRLRSLLRHTLERERVQEVPLCEELHFLALYTGIEQVRFSDRLRVETRVDAGAREALVPHLVLQPLVENAIRHGIAARRGSGRIEITAEAVEERLRLRVSDNGPGLSDTRSLPCAGVGLANTRARLRELYGAEQSFRLESVEGGGGVVVTITLPLRRTGGGNEVSREGGIR